MPISARILQAEADNLRPQPYRTAREQERYERILETAQAVFARHGTHNITLGNLAIALRMAPTTLRRHFADLDALLGEILCRHLLCLARALGEIPNDHPNRDPARRAAYLAATRTVLGGLTAPHLLLVRDRHTLPEDLLSQIELTRSSLGQLLAGPLADEALSFLDTTNFDGPTIEILLQSLAPTAHPAPEFIPLQGPPSPRPPGPGAGALQGISPPFAAVNPSALPHAPPTEA